MPGITRCGLLVDAIMLNLQMEKAQTAATVLNLELKTLRFDEAQE